MSGDDCRPQLVRSKGVGVPIWVIRTGTYGTHGRRDSFVGYFETRVGEKSTVTREDNDEKDRGLVSQVPLSKVCRRERSFLRRKGRNCPRKELLVVKSSAKTVLIFEKKKG